MLTALRANSRQPRGRVLSLGQLTLVSASVNWISGKLYWISMVFTGCQQKSLCAHSGALSASSHRLQDGQILKVVDSYRKLSVTQNLHVIMMAHWSAVYDDLCRTTRYCFPPLVLVVEPGHTSQLGK